MPHLLGAFLQAYPEVKPLLTVTNRARVIGRLTDNKDELIIMGQVPDHLELESHPFLSINNLRLELAGGHVAMLNVEGFQLKRHWYAVHLKGKQLSLVTRTFLDFLLRQGKDVLQHNIPVGQPDTGQVTST